MKKVMIVLAGLLPLVALAQTMPPNMPNFDPSKMPSGADMQKMMQRAQEMQKCMANIDQAELEQLEERGNAVSEEIRGLCASGDEDEALDLAISFSEEVRASQAMQDVQACSENLADLMPNLSLTEMVRMYDDAEDDLCDSMR